MHIQTHPAIDRELCGEPIALGPGTATVRLHTVPRMAVDSRGLVHGGFVFGAADYAAMLAVNDPLVVLGAASIRFVGPVAVGEDVVIVAERIEERGRRHKIEVNARVGEREVLTGTLTAYVVERHVLDR
ncbi:MAG: PaaI family thioesterase [Deltaproteobacteria bacterium]|nr:MAG: PaaI family thioesterase [Deltaproteobacteria bacterium]